MTCFQRLSVLALAAAALLAAPMALAGETMRVTGSLTTDGRKLLGRSKSECDRMDDATKMLFDGIREDRDGDLVCASDAIPRAEELAELACDNEGFQNQDWTCSGFGFEEPCRGMTTGSVLDEDAKFMEAAELGLAAWREGSITSAVMTDPQWSAAGIAGVNCGDILDIGRNTWYTFVMFGNPLDDECSSMDDATMLLFDGMREDRDGDLVCVSDAITRAEELAELACDNDGFKNQDWTCSGFGFEEPCRGITTGSVLDKGAEFMEAAEIGLAAWREDSVTSGVMTDPQWSAWGAAGVNCGDIQDIGKETWFTFAMFGNPLEEED